MNLPIVARGGAVSVSCAHHGNEETRRLAGHVHHLSSVANPFVKHVVKLRHNSSYRRASGSLVLLGDAPLRELCDIAPAKTGKKTFMDYLLVLEGSNAEDHLTQFAERVVQVTPGVMHKLSGVQSMEGCSAVGITSFPPSFCLLESSEDFMTALQKWCPSPRRLLGLDGVQDPGNLGTLLRTAAAFDWDGVFLLNSCCDPFNEKALRASRGACFWVPVACGELGQLQDFARTNNTVLYAAEPQYRTSGVPSTKQEISEHPLADIHEHESICLILGNEGQGLSKDARAACRLISIPMPGRFESLNVGVAGGILLYLLQKKS